VADDQLPATLEEVEEAGKMLVRRDLELTKANARLQELDAVKSEFVSVAAHQLRTPLTGIKWTLSALAQEEAGPLSKEQKQLVNNAMDGSDRLIALVSDLLNVSRLDEGRFGLAMEPLDFGAVVREVHDSLKPLATKKNLNYTLNIANDLPAIFADESKLKIVLVYLIDNAIKYTPVRGTVAVEAQLSKDASSIVASVKDSGIGIDPDQAGRIFEKFFRAKNAQLAATSGTGLGLFLSKNILERHGGTIWFTSSATDSGTTFHIRLPCTRRSRSIKKATTQTTNALETPKQ
jgi:signal transduction histidine kinase